MNKYQEALNFLEKIEGEKNYKLIGLFYYPQCDILQELVDKETPLTVNYIADGYADGYPVYDTATCPNCVRAFELDYEEHYKYCPNCGQRLNWEIENEE